MARSKRNKKSRDRHVQKNQGDKKKVVSIVTRELEVDSNESEEMVLSTAKNHLTDSVESAELGIVHGSTVVCNSNGRSLIQQLGDFSGKISALDEKFSARIADLEAKHSAEIERLESKHSAEIESSESKHSAEIERLESKHSAEIESSESKHSAEIESSESKHSAEIEGLESKHSARMAALEAQISTLQPFKAYFLDVRERVYLTYLRDFWTEYGPASRQKGRYPPNPKAAEIQGKISVLNRVILHGGNAEVDAMMLHERNPILQSKPFECLYGLRPESVKELASKGHRNIINLLSTAGSVHYESRHLTTAQQEAFDKVIELVNANKPGEAETLAVKSFHLFDIFELAGVTIQEE